MNINEAHNATLATLIDQMLAGDHDGMTKGDLMMHALDLMVANLKDGE